MSGGSDRPWEIERRIRSGEPVIDEEGYDWGPGLRAVHPAGEPYVPGPLPEGAVRVVLDAGDPYADDDLAGFQSYEEYPVIPRAHAVFDVPREWHERWESAREAWVSAQREIRALIEARADGRRS